MAVIFTQSARLRGLPAWGMLETLPPQVVVSLPERMGLHTTSCDWYCEGMDDADVIRRLTQLGLNSYEARAYVALAGRGSCAAADVARLSGLPRQRIYDVLASLVEKGLAS